MNKSDKKNIIDQKQLICAYAVMPFSDCYCTSISGVSIPKIAKYCMEENSGCPVYAKQRTVKTVAQVKTDD